MARPLRIEYPGAWYHVMNEGANRNRIFSKAKGHFIFLKVLQEGATMGGRKIMSFTSREGTGASSSYIISLIMGAPYLFN